MLGDVCVLDEKDDSCKRRSMIMCAISVIWKSTLILNHIDHMGIQTLHIFETRLELRLPRSIIPKEVCNLTASP